MSFLSSQPVRASVFDALHRQRGSGVAHNQHPAAERRVGRIHGMALPATFVTPVTSCRRHLINGVGCGCQRTSVSSHSNIQVCLCLHPLSPSPPPPPPTPTSPRHPSAHCLLPCSLSLYDIERCSELHRMQRCDLQTVLKKSKPI